MSNTAATMSKTEARDRAARALAAALGALTLLGTPLIGGVGPAAAATAHNSQAGSFGPTTRICAPTPYFPAGGCASAAVLDDRRYPFDIPASEERPAGRRAHPVLPADPFDD